MNYGSIKRRGGFTIIEVLVALAISTAFLSGVYYSFIQVVRAQDNANAREEALRNGRAAITTLSDEIKQVNKLGSGVVFIGVSADRGVGDGVDNDQDGRIDEDSVDGSDNDGDWTAAADRHANLGTVFERPFRVGRPDLGDGAVDEDAHFGNDTLLFRIYPTVATGGVEVKSVTYAITTFDGQPNTLVRQTRIDKPGEEPLIGVAPIAFRVLGFDLLYWNPNAEPAQQYYVQTWDSSRAATFDPPQLPLPANVYIRLTLYADPKPLLNYTLGQAVQTVVVDTVVDIEATINDAFFPRAAL